MPSKPRATLHRPSWNFPERATGAQKESATTWLTIIEPYLGQFRATFGMEDQDMLCAATGYDGGCGVVRITTEGTVISTTTGRRVDL